MDFSSSSHLNKWIVSEEKLTSLREAANKRGIDYVISLRTKHELPIENLSPLSLEEEHMYVSYYTRILASKGRKKYPPKVVATAVTFVKRFFLHHSCMEHEVIKVVFTCLYVSGKVCEHYIDAGSIAETFPNTVKAEEVLQLETSVLTGLQFDLVVYQPYHFVAAMIEELVASRDAQDQDLVALDSSWKQHEKKPDEVGRDVLGLIASYSRSCVDSIVQSDALLLMSPQQQALCAVCTALKNYGMPPDACLRRYTRLSSDDKDVQAQALAALEAVLKRGTHFAEAGFKALDKDEVKRLDLLIRQFNPLMDKTSKLYKELKKKKKKRKRDEGAQ